MDSIIHLAILIVFLNSCSDGAKLNLQEKQASLVLSCQDPGTPEHASREDQSTHFSPGEEVIYTCEFTYQLIGSPIRKCLANGTWSGLQPMCKKYMCDELDALPPRHGKRKGNDFKIGSQLKFACSTKYVLKGKELLTCLQSGYWSAEPPTCEHRCKTVKCDTGEKCQVTTEGTECVCRDNMDCSSRMDTVCGSDAVTYNNECIMNATACRNNKVIRKISRGKCVPGDTCSIYPVSKCRGAFQTFYYNVTKGTCNRITAGGCHPSGWNGFWTKAECRKHCVRDVCVLMPEVGPCEKRQTRWYYNAGKKTCEKFAYGGCFGNQNNFRTKEDCIKRCV